MSLTLQWLLIASVVLASALYLLREWQPQRWKQWRQRVLIWGLRPQRPRWLRHTLRRHLPPPSVRLPLDGCAGCEDRGCGKNGGVVRGEG